MNTDDKELEQLKHQLSLNLEKEKWSFKKEELKFLDAGQHLRSLNQLLWQVPGLAIAVTGGLWFGVTSLNDALTKQIIFFFTGVIDVLTVLTLIRLRQIIQLQINIQREFSDFAKGKDRQLPDKTVIVCWGAALIGAAIISFMAIFSPPSFSEPQKEPLKYCECCCGDGANKSEANNAESERKLAHESAEKALATNQPKEKSTQAKKPALRKKTICKT